MIYFGSFSLAGFLVIIFLLSISVYIQLSSIDTTSLAVDKKDKINNSKGIVLSIAIFSGISLVIQVSLMFYIQNKGVKGLGLEKFQGVEKCSDSLKCDD